MKFVLIIFVFFLLFLVCSCSNNDILYYSSSFNKIETDLIITDNGRLTSSTNEDIPGTEKTESITDGPDIQENTTEINPIIIEPVFPIGLYVRDGSTYINTKQYTGKWPASDSDKLWKKDTWTYPGKTNLICDLVSLNIIPKSEDTLKFKGRMGAEWNDLYNNCGLNINNYKVGLNFVIETFEGETIDWNVLSPDDTFTHEEFFELYLYDDVKHAKDSWYSHITSKDFNDSTVISSVKITLRNRCYEIKKIIVTAFYYTGASDFDESGRYIGVEKVSCEILSDY